MKKNNFVIMLMICMIMTASAYCENKNEKSVETEYEAQKKCAENAKQLFNKQGFPLYEHAEYRCHYNKKTNECFMLITTTSHIRNEKGRKIKKKSKILMDVGINKVLGNYVENSGQIPYYMLNDKACSPGEWKRQIKQYMGE